MEKADVDMPHHRLVPRKQCVLLRIILRSGHRDVHQPRTVSKDGFCVHALVLSVLESIAVRVTWKDGFLDDIEYGVFRYLGIVDLGNGKRLQVES